MSSLVVSIHDVSPLTLQKTRAILSDLKSLGLSTYSLLVIPNHHRRGHFLKDPEFCTWLKEETAGGQEIIIHGYFHQRASKESESPRDKFMTRLYTANEGEFYDIEEAEALALVSKAREEFASIGLSPAGFIAPAWLLSHEGEKALAKLGIRYTTRLGGVIDLTKRQTIASQSMVYSVRSAWRRKVSLGWNAWLYQRLSSNPLLRIGIHPVDFDHPAIWNQICNRVSKALVQRKAVSYAGFLGANN